MFAGSYDAQGRSYLVYPLEEVCSSVAAIIASKDLVRPWQLLNHFRISLGILTMAQVRVPEDCRVKSLSDYKGSTVCTNLQLSLSQQERQKLTSPASTPVRQRAERQTLSEAEHLLLLEKMLTSTHRDLLPPLRAATGLSLLLACGGRSQVLNYMGFNGFTTAVVSTSNAMGNSIKMFKLVNAGRHKTHQGGRKDEIGLIQAKDPLLEPRGSSVHGVGKAAGLAIPDLIALEDARWLDIKLLAEVASPAIVVQGAVGRALRSFISRFDKEVVTRLGRNSLVGRLLKEGVGEFQISTLMKWNIGHTMQATYATRDPASVLPAFITAAGFPAGAGVRYSIPRASVVVEAVAPTLHSKLFPAAALMYSLEEEKVGLQAAIQEAKDKAESEQLWRQYQLADGAIKAYKALACKTC